MSKLELRPSTDADFDFLYHVLKTTMRAYVEQIWGWDEVWQRTHAREDFQPGKDEIIVLNGQDIGVFSPERREAKIFLDKI